MPNAKQIQAQKSSKPKIKLTRQSIAAPVTQQTCNAHVLDQLDFKFITSALLAHGWAEELLGRGLFTERRSGRRARVGGCAFPALGP